MEGIKMAIDLEKRQQFDMFMESMQYDKEGLELSSIYGLYLALITNKDLIYSAANVRRILIKEKGIKTHSIQKTSEAKITKFEIKPKIFAYLSENSEKGEEARRLYKAMLIYRGDIDSTLSTIVANTKNKTKLLEDELSFNLIKDSAKLNKDLVVKELNSAISSIVKTLSASKLLALSHVKKTYDNTKDEDKPKIYKYVLDAVYTIRAARSTEEVKVYRNKFNQGIKSINKEK
jgi:hypothetical protein